MCLVGLSRVVALSEDRLVVECYSVVLIDLDIECHYYLAVGLCSILVLDWICQLDSTPFECYLAVCTCRLGECYIVSDILSVYCYSRVAGEGRVRRDHILELYCYALAVLALLCILVGQCVGQRLICFYVIAVDAVLKLALLEYILDWLAVGDFVRLVFVFSVKYYALIRNDDSFIKYNFYFEGNYYLCSVGYILECPCNRTSCSIDFCFWSYFDLSFSSILGVIRDFVSDRYYICFLAGCVLISDLIGKNISNLYRLTIDHAFDSA